MIDRTSEVFQLPDDLTERQKEFVLAYFECGCRPSEAALLINGGEEKNARERARWYLTRPQVKREVERIRGEIAERFFIDKTRLIREAAAVALSNIGDFVEWDDDGAKFKPSTKIDREVLAAVAEASETRGKHGKMLRVKLHNKMDAIAELNRMLGYHAPQKLANADGGNLPGLVEIRLTDSPRTTHE